MYLVDQTFSTIYFYNLLRVQAVCGFNNRLDLDNGSSILHGQMSLNPPSRMLCSQMSPCLSSITTYTYIMRVQILSAVVFLRTAIAQL